MKPWTVFALFLAAVVASAAVQAVPAEEAHLEGKDHFTGFPTLAHWAVLQCASSSSCCMTSFLSQIAEVVVAVSFPTGASLPCCEPS